MSFVKVDGTAFVRDTNSMGIINTDSHAKNEYLAKVRMINTQKSEINKVNQEINQLKSDLSDIKELLQQLILK